MPVTQDEIKTWYTRSRAASIIGCSERQIERWSADTNKDARTKIKRLYLKIPGRKKMPMFRPEDVDRIRTDKVAGQATVEEAASDAQAGQMKMAARGGGQLLASLAEAQLLKAENERELISGLVPALEAFAAGVERLLSFQQQRPELTAAPVPQALLEAGGAGRGKKPRPVVRLERKLLLTIEEAVAFGFSAGELRRKIVSGELLNRGSKARFKIARRDLDALAGGAGR